LLESDHPYVSALNGANLSELKKHSQIQQSFRLLFLKWSELGNEDFTGSFTDTGATLPGAVTDSIHAAVYLWKLFVAGRENGRSQTANHPADANNQCPLRRAILHREH